MRWVDSVGHHAIYSRLLGRYVVGANFDVVDQNVSIVDSGRQLVGKLHVSVDYKLNMMRTGW